MKKSYYLKPEELLKLNDWNLLNPIHISTLVQNYIKKNNIEDLDLIEKKKIYGSIFQGLKKHGQKIEWLSSGYFYLHQEDKNTFPYMNHDVLYKTLKGKRKRLNFQKEKESQVEKQNDLSSIVNLIKNTKFYEKDYKTNKLLSSNIEVFEDMSNSKKKLKKMLEKKKKMLKKFEKLKQKIKVLKKKIKKNEV